jgi:hypothetical protein
LAYAILLLAPILSFTFACSGPGKTLSFYLGESFYFSSGETLFRVLVLFPGTRYKSKTAAVCSEASPHFSATQAKCDLANREMVAEDKTKLIETADHDGTAID